METEKIVATLMGGAKSTVGLSSSSSAAADIVGFSVSKVKNGETEAKNGETEVNKPQTIISAADVVGFSVSDVKNGETEAKDGETEAKDGETKAKDGETEAKNGETEAKNGDTEANKPQIITSAADIVGFSVSEAKNGETEAKNGKTEVNKTQIISPMQLIPDVLRTKTVETMSELDARKAALEMKKMKKALMEGENAAWNVEM